MPTAPKKSNTDRVSLARKRALIEEHRQLAKTVGPAAARMKQIEAELKTAMGDATFGTIGRDTVVTWTTNVREGIDVPAFRLEQPEIAAKYIKTTTVRTFKILPEKSDS